MNILEIIVLLVSLPVWTITVTANEPIRQPTVNALVLNATVPVEMASVNSKNVWTGTTENKPSYIVAHLADLAGNEATAEWDASWTPTATPVDTPTNTPTSESNLLWSLQQELSFDGNAGQKICYPPNWTGSMLNSTIAIRAKVQTSNLNQLGPARILTQSIGTVMEARNWTIGQATETLAVRLRNSDGLVRDMYFPQAFISPGEIIDFVIAHDGNMLKIWKNGSFFAAESFLWNASGFNDSYSLCLGDEWTDNRPWEGVIHEAGVALRPEAFLFPTPTGVATGTPYSTPTEFWTPSPTHPTPSPTESPTASETPLESTSTQTPEKPTLTSTETPTQTQTATKTPEIPEVTPTQTEKPAELPRIESVVVHQPTWWQLQQAKRRREEQGFWVHSVSFGANEYIIVFHRYQSNPVLEGGVP